jgi:PAS domain S-box-containing protein
MIIADDTGIIMFANQQLSALFGYASEELAGRSIEQLMPERFRDQHAVHREGYEERRRNADRCRGEAADSDSHCGMSVCPPAVIRGDNGPLREAKMRRGDP